MIKLFIDGGSRGNPGIAGCGWLIVDGNTQYTNNRFIGIATNNEAEYSGLIFGLEDILKITADREINIFSDSLLLINQINGDWKVKHPNIKKLYAKAMDILMNFTWQATHIPREQNTIADREANKAMDRKK